jgi:hypothetical protein
MKPSGSIVEQIADATGAEHHSHSFAQSFPLLAIALALFALLNVATDATRGAWLTRELLRVHQMSGDVWHISWGDAFLGLSLSLLFVEIVRSTNTTTSSILNHALSALVFMSALWLFVTQPGYGNSPFCLFTGMTLVDFVAGFIVTTVAARRDVVIQH